MTLVVQRQDWRRASSDGRAVYLFEEVEAQTDYAIAQPVVGGGFAFVCIDSGRFDGLTTWERGPCIFSHADDAADVLDELVVGGIIGRNAFIVSVVSYFAGVDGLDDETVEVARRLLEKNSAQLELRAGKSRQDLGEGPSSLPQEGSPDQG